MTNQNQQIIDRIKAAFLHHFPKGYVYAAEQTFCGEKYISVRIGLIGDLDRVTNKIRENDPMYHSWVINIEDDKYIAELSVGSLSVEPPEGSFHAMGAVGTGWRKTSGDASRVIKAYERFFLKLFDIVQANKTKIYRVEKIIDLIP